MTLDKLLEMLGYSTLRFILPPTVLLLQVSDIQRILAEIEKCSTLS